MIVTKIISIIHERKKQRKPGGRFASLSFSFLYMWFALWLINVQGSFTTNKNSISLISSPQLLSINVDNTQNCISVRCKLS